MNADLAIYSFTGASIGNILNFSTTFEGAKIFILNLNYRSTPEILAACQNLIRHNVRKIEIRDMSVFQKIPLRTNKAL